MSEFTPRTPEEIVARIRAIESADFFGTITSDLLACLPFADAKPWLKDEAKASDWTADAADAESIKARMLDYMAFAWEKANNQRGLSAMRSLNHMQGWLWLLREEVAADALDGYSHYGKPQLRAICEHYGWDWRQWDDGEWANNEGDPGEKPESVADAEVWP